MKIILMNDYSFVELIFLFIFFLCIGSFLNSLAYRLLYNKNIFAKRSYCPHCFTTIAWYDLFPLFSFILLKGKARCCGNLISFLYPLGELLCAVSCTAIAVLYPWYTAIALISFVCLLCISFYTDAQEFVLLRLCTWYAVPIGLLCAYFSLLPITFFDSVMGAGCGYGVLWFIGYVYQLLRHREGLGNGDPELLALIGSFCGVSGCFFILFIASVLGSCYGIAMGLLQRNYAAAMVKFPFGPFLIIATIVWIILQPFDLLCRL